MAIGEQVIGKFGDLKRRRQQDVAENGAEGSQENQHAKGYIGMQDMGGIPRNTPRRTGYGGVLTGPVQQEVTGRNENDIQAETIKQGKYQDATGMHDIHAGEGTRNVEGLSGTLGGLGQAIGNTLGAGINVIHTGIKKAVNAIGGFFKKLFGKKKKK